MPVFQFAPVFLTVLFLGPSAALRGSASNLIPGACSNQHQQPGASAVVTCVLSAAAKLMPEASPHAQPDQRSASGVAYGPVLQGLDVLYPPASLDSRNAMSRRDGYWPFLQRGNDPPPPSLTYGEFDFYFFAQLLDRVLQYADGPRGDTNGWNDKTFCDLGSGTGRLVLAAAALHPGWKLCRGVEVLPLISAEADHALEQCRRPPPDNNYGNDHDAHDEGPDKSYALPQSQLPLAPVDFCCGSLDDPHLYFGDTDLVFVFSSCMDTDTMNAIAVAVGRQCRPGTLVITTDYMLPLEGNVPPVESPERRIPGGQYQLKLLEQVDGWCWLTGGASTAFVHRVEQSLGVGRIPVREYGAGTLTDTRAQT